jgi:hypothetical protein
MLFVSRISKESIGYGDGMLVVELGFIFGFQASLEMVVISLWLMFPLTCYIFQRRLWKNYKDSWNYQKYGGKYQNSRWNYHKDKWKYDKSRTRKDSDNEKINREEQKGKYSLENEQSVKIIRLPYIPFLMISYCIWLFHIQEFISEKLKLWQDIFISKIF